MLRLGLTISPCAVLARLKRGYLPCQQDHYTTLRIVAGEMKLGTGEQPMSDRLMLPGLSRSSRKAAGSGRFLETRQSVTGPQADLEAL